MSDRELKDSILLNATSLFAEKGFSKTSLQKIADISQTSQTNILYHFKTKKKLFEACLFSAIAKNRQTLTKDNYGDPKDSLFFLLDSNVRWATQRPKDCQLFLLLYYFASNDEYFQNLTIKITNDAKDLLGCYIDKLNLKKGQDRSMVISLLQNYIHGVMFNIMATKEKNIESNYKKNIKSLISFIFE